MTSASEAPSRPEPDWYVNVYRAIDGVQWFDFCASRRAADRLATSAPELSSRRVFILRIWEKAK